MKKLSALVAVLVLAFSTGSAFAAASAFAADVTGAWSGDAGQFQLTFNFKQDGTKLTGSVQGPQDPITISDGKVEGDKITFTVSFDGNIIHHTGTIAGDTIKLNTEGGNFGGGEMILKRVSTKPAIPPAS
jgi:hypothetical protein